MALGCRRVTEGQMLFTYPPGRIEREVSRKDWCAARLTRVIAALAEPLEGPVDVVKDSLRLGQLGFIAFFHLPKVPRHGRARVRTLSR